MNQLTTTDWGRGLMVKRRLHVECSRRAHHGRPWVLVIGGVVFFLASPFQLFLCLVTCMWHEAARLSSVHFPSFLSAPPGGGN